jgi:hypothetical protein
MTLTWYVIFSDPDPLGDVSRRRDRFLYSALMRLRPGFRHCYAMRRAEKFEGWIIINPVSSGVDVQEVDDQNLTVAGHTFSSYAQFVDAMVAAGRAYRVESQQQAGRYWKPRGLFSCVGVIKHLLAMEAPWVWTPWQLYKHLGGNARS